MRNIMIDIVGYAAANPLISAVVALVVIVGGVYVGKKYIKLGGKTEPTPDPEPIPDPVYTGVEIKTADFFGNGSFTAAVFDPAAWEKALGGKGKFEYRVWGDNENLYTVLVKTKDGLVYSKTCMYRLGDNTVVTTVKAGTDPFFPKQKTVMEQYNEMWVSPSPYKYMMTEFNRVDVNLCIVFGPTKGIDNYAKYKAEDVEIVGYVKNLLPLALANAQKEPVELQRVGCRQIFAALFNYKV